MISFVNIKSGTFWDFESWEEIKKLGGLKALLPEDEWEDIWNEEACKGPNAFSSLEDSVQRGEAIKLFNSRK